MESKHSYDELFNNHQQLKGEANKMQVHITRFDEIQGSTRREVDYMKEKKQEITNQRDQEKMRADMAEEKLAKKTLKHKEYKKMYAEKFDEYLNLQGDHE